MNDSAFAAAFQQHQLGNLREAEHLYRAVLQQDARHSDAMHLLGIVVYQSGNAESGAELIRAAIKINPSEAIYYSNLGNILEDLHRHNEAQTNYLHAIALQPQYADAHYNLGLSYYRQGHLQSSIDCFRSALTCNQKLPAAWNNLGVALMELKNYPAAELSLKMAIQLSPDYTEALLNLGNLLQKTGKHAEARIHVEKALRLKPDYAEAWNTLGVIFDNLDLPDAIACFREALQYKPIYPEAISNLGRTLSLVGAGEEGIALLRKAISLKPDFADAHWNLAFALLLHGQYLEGWREHEWRWKMKNLRSPKRNFSQPLWQGENLKGKRLLLHAEQGFGDAIQFSRFIPMAETSEATIILEVREPVRRLMTGIPGVSQIVSYGDPLPDFDAHCPLMSLPLVFGTMLDNIPPPLEFPSLAVSLSQAKTSDTGPLKVGLVWAGNPEHGLDRRRSIPLKALLPLKDISGVSYFCAFKGPAATQTPELDFQISDLCSEAKDFFDTAKEIAKLDLVISVDTAVAHLAATLGKPVWLLISHTPDWRWLSGREDSPWYPSMRIFRQRSLGDWNSLIMQVAQELSALAKNTASE